MPTVTVIYKSGQKVRFKCKSFTAVRNQSVGLKEVTWEESIHPKPLFFNVDEVESIWEGKV